MVGLVKILLTGDSITAAGRNPGDPTELGDGYAARLAAELSGHEVLNTGLNGNKIPDLQQRWERDVLAHRPGLLSIKVGINDTWHAYFQGGLRARLTNLVRHTGGGTSHQVYESGYREILERSQAAGIEQIVLVEPFVIPVDDDQLRMVADLEERMRTVRRLASDYGALFVPLHEVFTLAAQQREPAELIIDGVHPTSAGHDLIAQQWMRVVGPEIVRRGVGHV